MFCAETGNEYFVVDFQGDCARLLLLRGADKNLENKSQQTPEQVARSSGHEAIAKCICDFHQGQVGGCYDVNSMTEVGSGGGGGEGGGYGVVVLVG